MAYDPDRYGTNHGPSGDSLQQAATLLIQRKLRVFDPNHSDELITLPVRTLLDDARLPELLFGAIPTKPHCQEGNAEVYGPGHEDIAHEWAALRMALLRLARTGEYDRDVLSHGEDVLATLISGVRNAEEAARRNINPANAARLASIDQYVGGEISLNQMDEITSGEEESRATPDQIEDVQSDACFCYRWYKSGREVLEALHHGIGDINRQADRGRAR